MIPCATCGNPKSDLEHYSPQRGGISEMQCVACNRMLNRAWRDYSRGVVDARYWKPMSEEPRDERWVLVQLTGTNIPDISIWSFSLPYDSFSGGLPRWCDQNGEVIPQYLLESFRWAYFPGTFDPLDEQKEPQ